MRHLTPFGVALVAFASGCTRTVNLHLCVPGEQRACACTGGGSGVQSCNPEASGFEDCRGCAGDSDAGNGPHPGSGDLADVQEPDANIPLQSDMAVPDSCGGCPSPLVCCGSACVNPLVDPQNCGGCGHICATGSCGDSIEASMATPPSSWNFNGDAFYDGISHTAVLTANQMGQGGSVLYQNPITTDEFDVSFDFRIAPHGADGLGFVIETDGNNALGLKGSGLGMATLNGFGVEFDPYNNDSIGGGCGESVAGDHVNIDSLNPCTVGGGQQTLPSPLPFGNGTLAPQAYTFADGESHTALIHLESGQLTVAVKTGAQTTILFDKVPLPTSNNPILFTPGGAYYFGFTAATGGIAEQHEVRNVSIRFPSPRCL